MTGPLHFPTEPTDAGPRLIPPATAPADTRKGRGEARMIAAPTQAGAARERPGPE
ncbi:hypothetical protein QQG74_18950 [Micromonospora sp. FIMYZ51]|uniref:hypothetical protein n=1 Tax=Micromonospora sp. FIMYZ51 TaxID=3051832 RepID=UPI00311E2879